jgi:hypothetical protein
MGHSSTEMSFEHYVGAVSHEAGLAHFQIRPLDFCPASSVDILATARPARSDGTRQHAPHNALRHCYVSNYLMKHGSIDSLLLESGHSRAVMFEHYLNIVSTSEVAKYWNLRP